MTEADLDLHINQIIMLTCISVDLISKLFITKSPTTYMRSYKDLLGPKFLNSLATLYEEIYECYANSVLVVGAFS